MKRRRWLLLSAVLLSLLIGGCKAKFAQAPEPALSAPAYDTGLLGVSSEASRSVFEAPSTEQERMVVYRATLDFVVSDTRQALDEIDRITEELGGYIASLNTHQYERGETAIVVLRVPANRLDVALERLRGLAKTIQRESVSSEDITEEYIDLESRLRHLEAKERQLLEFLERAEDTEAVLAVYGHLSQTQAEIEQVKGRMRYLESHAALASITVNLTPDELAQPLETGEWNLPKTVRRAVQVMLKILWFLVSALIYFVIVVLPVLLLLSVFGYGGYRLVRVLSRWILR